MTRRQPALWWGAGEAVIVHGSHEARLRSNRRGAGNSEAPESGTRHKNKRRSWPARDSVDRRTEEKGSDTGCEGRGPGHFSEAGGDREQSA